MVYMTQQRGAYYFQMRVLAGTAANTANSSALP